MKKRLLAMTSVLLLAVLLLSLAGCGGSAPASPAVGTWVGQYAKFVGDSDPVYEEFSLELKADGKGVHHRDDMDFDVTWKLEGDKLSMDEKFIGDPIHYTGTLTGDDLNLFNGDPADDLTYEYVYVRKGGTSAKTAGASGSSATAAPAASAEPAASAVTEAPAASAAETTAASGGDVGKYMIYEYEANGVKVSHDMLTEAGMGSSYLELRADGTATLNLFDTEMDAVWTPGVVTVYKTTDYTYKLNGDVLTLDMAGVTYVMHREGSAATAASETTDTPEPTATPATVSDAPGGTGVVSEEALQKGYVWMNKVAKDLFHTTYEELVDYFGVEGQFDKEEYSEHMQVNKRYYKWVSADDSTHFIYVNFEEDEPGVYTVSSYNTSGFSGADAEALYLEAVLAAALEEDKAAAATMEMKDFSIEITPFGNKEDVVKVLMQIPASGWSYDEKKAHLVDNENPDTFGAGFIQFKLDDKVEDFDFYKDKFENYQDIADREIGGVVMKGRTYKNIGYEWTEYIAQLDDAHAISIGIVRVDVSAGTVGDRILNSVKFA